MPYMSLEERLSQAVAVVSGEVVSIVEISFSPEKFGRKVAIVKVNDVKKGDVPSEFILVSFGMVLPAKLKSSQEIAVNQGEQGQWILAKDATGLFVLNRPENFRKINE